MGGGIEMDMLSRLSDFKSFLIFAKIRLNVEKYLKISKLVKSTDIEKINFLTLRSFKFCQY